MIMIIITFVFIERREKAIADFQKSCVSIGTHILHRLIWFEESVLKWPKKADSRSLLSSVGEGALQLNL